MENCKKPFEQSKIEIILFCEKDVITSSKEDNDPNQGEWVKSSVWSGVYKI